MAVVRHTLGWKRESISLTVAEMMTLTNLARASAVAGIRDALEHGYITREARGKSFDYRVAEFPQQAETVQKVNRQDDGVPARKGDEPVQKVDHQEVESVQKVDCQDDEPVQKVDHKSPESVQKVNSKSVQKVNPIERNINTNNQEQERGERARAPARISSRHLGAPVKHCHSPYLDARRFVNGFIPPGTGRNAVEVYYERFEIESNDWRLTEPLEDDLVLACKDLNLLREVVIAYDQANFVKPRNVRLILDWYQHPERFREGRNGNYGTSNPTDYQPPAAATFTQAEWREYAAQKRTELPF